MPAKVKLKRSQAAQLIKEIALVLAKEEHSETLNGDVVEGLIGVFKKHEVPLPKPCTGEAHGPNGAFIDHCGACMPNWEWVCPEVQVT